MSSSPHPRKSQRYTRSDRVAHLMEGDHPLLALARAVFWRDSRGVLWLSSLLFVVVIGLVTEAWYEPFPYHVGMVPPRNIDCVAPFTCESAEGLLKAQNRARTTVQHIYRHNPQLVLDLRRSLMSLLAVIERADSFETLDDNGRAAWRDLTLKRFGTSDTASPAEIEAFASIHNALADDPTLERTSERLASVFAPLERFGLLDEIDFGPHEGSQDRLRVYSMSETPERAVVVPIIDVLRKNCRPRMDAALQQAFGNDSPLVPFLSAWIASSTVATLQKDFEATQHETQQVLAEIPPVVIQFGVGQTIAVAGKPIEAATLQHLYLEYQRIQENQPWWYNTTRFLAFTCFFLMLLVLAWTILLRWERRRPRSLRSIIAFQLSLLGTALTMLWFLSWSNELRHIEILPLLIFAQWVSILYSWGFSLAFTLILSFITVHTTSLDSNTVMVMVCTALVVCIQIDRLRSRSRLVMVSLAGGVVASLLTLMLELMDGRLLDRDLCYQAALCFVWVILSGFVMTGVLPFIERSLGVLTDMSLLDWGNGSHPLLQELIHRAPATYNHSIQVGTIAETAVKAIGGRELLTRVGACFHDIGKVFKPEYFAENQGSGENIHNTLEPRISTLVIVSHVKDGTDLARQYHLPTAIVDLIEQHHGTSLVSYFYGVANRHNREGGASMPLEEGSFRYPGPKPQSKEAAVLMLADAAESACRSLDAGSPHRIENMVRQITKIKLDDGQFDESGLTLREIHTIENSVIVSLIAIKHGRIKYPGQDKIENDTPAATKMEPLKGDE